MPGRSARRTSAFRGRSPREQAVRIGLAIAALGAGYVSASHALASALRSQAPERAYRLAPADGRIAAELSAKKSTVAKPRPGQLESAVRLAVAAREREPLAVEAIATLAVARQFRGQARLAEDLFSYSNKLSRRDLRTRLWAIENAVARDDVPAALRHYDIAMRTSRRAPEILFPVLSIAVADPVIARNLVALLGSNPPWGESFIVQLPGSGLDPLATVEFFRSLSARRVPIHPSAKAAIVNKLISADEHGQAWAFYSRMRGYADPAQSRDPGFRAAIDSPSLFDWTPINAVPGIDAALQRNKDSGLFDFSAPSTVGAQILLQYQMLPPGRYRIEGRSAGIDQSAGARPYWSLTCVDGRELGRVDVSNSDESDGRFAGVFEVGAKCPTQILSFNIRPSYKTGGVSGQIEQVSLKPISRSKREPKR